MTRPDPDRPETVVLGSVTDIESLSEAIVLAVAEERDEAVEDLTPLGERLDTDALDDLFVLDDATPRVDARLCFRYDGYHVAIDTDGPVLIRRVP